MGVGIENADVKVCLLKATAPKSVGRHVQPGFNITTVTIIIIIICVVTRPSSILGDWGLYPHWAPTDPAGKHSEVHVSVKSTRRSMTDQIGLDCSITRSTNSEQGAQQISMTTE